MTTLIGFRRDQPGHLFDSEYRLSGLEIRQRHGPQKRTQFLAPGRVANAKNFLDEDDQFIERTMDRKNYFWQKTQKPLPHQTQSTG
jgi:hypothetical protein